MGTKFSDPTLLITGRDIGYFLGYKTPGGVTWGFKRFRTLFYYKYPLAIIKKSRDYNNQSIYYVNSINFSKTAGHMGIKFGKHTLIITGQGIRYFWGIKTQAVPHGNLQGLEGLSPLNINI